MALIPIGPVLPLNFGIDKILSRTNVNYSSLDQIKGWLHRVDLDLHGIEGDFDAELKMARSRAKRLINGYLMTEYDYVRRMEWFSGNASNTADMRFYPIVELEYIRMYNIDYQNFFQYSGSELIVISHTGIIKFPAFYITSNPYKALGASLYGWQFFPGIKNVHCVYTSGFMNDEVPGDFSEACAQWTAGLLLRDAHLRLSEGLRSRVVNGVQENYGDYFTIGTQYIEEAKQVLIKYSRTMIR